MSGFDTSGTSKNDDCPPPPKVLIGHELNKYGTNLNSYVSFLIYEGIHMERNRLS